MDKNVKNLNPRRVGQDIYDVSKCWREFEEWGT